MNWARSIRLLCFAVCLAVCAAASDLDGVARRLRAAVTFLASDDLEGRGTPSRGLDLAALYLETELQAAGVLPAHNGSYRQSYTVGTYLPARAKVALRVNGKTVEPAHYLFINFGWDPTGGPLSLPLVDAGYGIVAEEKNTDHLSALDLRGKGAVARKGAPWPLDPAAVFGPDRAMGKLMAASVRGAKLLVYTTGELEGGDAEAGFFQQMKNAPVSFMRAAGVPHVSALGPLLVLDPAALPAAGGNIEIAVEAPVEEGHASNVLGIIEGADPALQNEWVVLSAHYDHLGSHQVPPGEDGIWNGADDNASGTAAVLEMARELARRPGRRSVLVFFTSGEDRGIFGSAYYAAHPLVPMERVAVQINLDMIGRSEGEVQAIAPVSPPLFQEAVEAGRRHGVKVLPDQQPLWRVLYLTDNYHFARAGVPGVHFFTGLHRDYHQPSDTADKLRYPEMARIFATALALARDYADGKPRPAFQRPKWFVTPVRNSGALAIWNQDARGGR